MNARPEAILFNWQPDRFRGGDCGAAPDPLRFDAAGNISVQVDQAMARLCETTAGSPLYPMVTEHLAAGGKRVRARLAVEAARSAGAPHDASVWWAAACEMLHNATLVHDDLQDGDAVRRGRPALWARYGAAQAINAGDMMLMLAYRAVERATLPAETRAALTACLARRTVETACGQAHEIELTERADTDWDRYLHAAMGKTGQFFAMPVEGAMLCAGARPDAARRIGDAFGWVGVLFQIIDDVVDLYGSKGREAAGADIREGKISALVIQHLQLAPTDRTWLVNILQTPREQTTPQQVAAVRQRFSDSGGLERTLDLIRRGHDFIESHPELQPTPALRTMGLFVLEQASQSIRELLDHSRSLELQPMRNA